MHPRNGAEPRLVVALKEALEKREAQAEKKAAAAAATPAGTWNGMVQFPDGAWSPFRVAKVFASRAEAEAYGRAHGLPLQGAE